MKEFKKDELQKNLLGLFKKKILNNISEEDIEIVYIACDGAKTSAHLSQLKKFLHSCKSYQSSLRSSHNSLEAEQIVDDLKLHARNILTDSTVATIISYIKATGTNSNEDYNNGVVPGTFDWDTIETIDPHKEIRKKKIKRTILALFILLLSGASILFLISKVITVQNTPKPMPIPVPSPTPVSVEEPIWKTWHSNKGAMPAMAIPYVIIHIEEGNACYYQFNVKIKDDGNFYYKVIDGVPKYSNTQDHQNSSTPFIDMIMQAIKDKYGEAIPNSRIYWTNISLRSLSKSEQERLSKDHVIDTKSIKFDEDNFIEGMPQWLKQAIWSVGKNSN